MKLKKTIHTYILEGRVDVAELCTKIFADTGIRFMLEKPGQELAGYLNAYYRKYEEVEYTLVDVFYYDDDTQMEADERLHGPKHKLRRIFLTKKKTRAIVDSISTKWKFVSEDLATQILAGIS